MRRAVKRVCAQGEEWHYKFIHQASGQLRVSVHAFLNRDIALGRVAAEIYNRTPESPCSNSTLYILYTPRHHLYISAQIWQSPHAASIN